MATEKYANGGASTLNGAHNNSTTTLTVNDGSVFPSSGQFRVIVGAEIMLCTARSGNNLTVTRGAESTIAVSHGSGDDVKTSFTKGALDQIIADNIQSGAIASLPAAEKAGRLYLATDAPYAYRDNGSAWAAFGPQWKLTPPISADYAWVNQGSATIATTNGGVLITDTSAAGSLRIRKKTQPSTPYTITALMIPELGVPVSDTLVGIGFRESATGKLETLHWVYSVALTDVLIAAVKWTDATTFSANRAFLSASKQFPIRFLRIKHDGTTLSYQYSSCGYYWQTLASAAKGNFFTTAPNEVFFFACGGADVSAHLLSWEETA